MVSRIVEKAKGPNCRVSWAMAEVWASILKTEKPLKKQSYGNDTCNLIIVVKNPVAADRAVRVEPCLGVSLTQPSII